MSPATSRESDLPVSTGWFFSSLGTLTLAICGMLFGLLAAACLVVAVAAYFDGQRCGDLVEMFVRFSRCAVACWLPVSLLFWLLCRLDSRLRLDHELQQILVVFRWPFWSASSHLAHFHEVHCVAVSGLRQPAARGAWTTGLVLVTRMGRQIKLPLAAAEIATVGPELARALSVPLCRSARRSAPKTASPRHLAGAETYLWSRLVGLAPVFALIDVVLAVGRTDPWSGLVVVQTALIQGER